MSHIETKNIRIGDVKEFLKSLLDESLSQEKVKSILKTFWNISSDSEDYIREIMENGGVEVLLKLFKSSKEKKIRGHITSILVMMSSENSQSEIVSIAVCNILTESDPNVFLQCVSGIIETVTLQSTSSALATRFLSVASSALLFEKSALLLSSPMLRDIVKQEVLTSVVVLAKTGAMNEAAEFVGWRYGGKDGSRSEKSEGGDAIVVPAVLFLRAFEAFSTAVKNLSLDTGKLFLSAGAERVYQTIQQNKFFPTFASPLLLAAITPKSGLGALAAEDLVSKFLPNEFSSSAVTMTDNKLTWQSQAIHTFAVDLEIAKGIYKICVECKYGIRLSSGYFGFGVATKEALNSLRKGCMDSYKGVCSIDSAGIHCGGSFASQSSLFKDSGNVSLALELDADNHALYFFVNEKQIPHCVVNVPSPVQFAIQGGYSGAFTVDLKSLQKMSAPSIDSSLSCAMYLWK